MNGYCRLITDGNRLLEVFSTKREGDLKRLQQTWDWDCAADKASWLYYAIILIFFVLLFLDWFVLGYVDEYKSKIRKHESEVPTYLIHHENHLAMCNCHKLFNFIKLVDCSSLAANLDKRMLFIYVYFCFHTRSFRATGQALRVRLVSVRVRRLPSQSHVTFIRSIVSLGFLIKIYVKFSISYIS